MRDQLAAIGGKKIKKKFCSSVGRLSSERNEKMGKSVLEFAADLGSQHKSGQIFQVALFHLPGICYFSSVITGPKVEPDVDHSAFSPHGFGIAVAGRAFACPYPSPRWDHFGFGARANDRLLLQ